MARAYLLIKVARGEGKLEKVIDELQKTPTVVRAKTISGPYDIMVILEAPTQKEILHDVVVKKVCNLPEVYDTITLPETE